MLYFSPVTLLTHVLGALSRDSCPKTGASVRGERMSYFHIRSVGGPSRSGHQGPAGSPTQPPILSGTRNAHLPALFGWESTLLVTPRTCHDAGSPTLTMKCASLSSRSWSRGCGLRPCRDIDQLAGVGVAANIHSHTLHE